MAVHVACDTDLEDDLYILERTTLFLIIIGQR